MKAIILGAQSIKLGDNDVVVVGGTESMSNTPHYLPTSRKGVKYGDASLVDGVARDGLTDAYISYSFIANSRYDLKPMGVAAETCAKRYSFTREDQDDFAIQSYKRAQAAQAKNYFHEIEPMEVPGPKGKPATIIKDDEDAKIVSRHRSHS